MRKADINPLDVDYVETWGQGTHLHDAVEASALTRAYRYRETDEDQEMLSVGCVKGNLGNALTAAGTMQFIKVTESHTASSGVDLHVRLPVMSISLRHVCAQSCHSSHGSWNAFLRESRCPVCNNTAMRTWKLKQAQLLEF